MLARKTRLVTVLSTTAAASAAVGLYVIPTHASVKANPQLARTESPAYAPYAPDALRPHAPVTPAASAPQAVLASAPTALTVRPGDTLSALAASVDRTWQAFAAYNRLADANWIMPGQVLKVPPAGYVGAYSPPHAAAPAVTYQPVHSYSAPAPVSYSGGGCYGITNPTALWIISKESGCNIYAYNRSGACGIGQRMNRCDGYNGYAQAADMTSYVMGRYGSWDAAAAHERAYGWY